MFKRHVLNERVFLGNADYIVKLWSGCCRSIFKNKASKVCFSGETVRSSWEGIAL